MRKRLADGDDCAGSLAERLGLYRALRQLDRAALCLSGGGIRSAAFGLGVIQALATHPRPHKSRRNMFEGTPARHGLVQEEAPQAGQEAAAPAQAAHEAEAARQATQGALARQNSVAEPQSSLLAQLRYLSTVSGGGYIGSWLSAWRYRVSFEAMRNNLVGRPSGPDVEPHALGWLRLQQLSDPKARRTLGRHLGRNRDLAAQSPAMIFVGLSSYQRQSGRPAHDTIAQSGTRVRGIANDIGWQDDSDSDREWLGRTAGWYLVAALGWFVVTFLIFAGSLVLTSLGQAISAWIGPLGGVGGVLTALIGKSSLTPGRGAAARGAKPMLSIGIILGIAAPLFAAALLIFLSAALDALLLKDSLVILLRYPQVQIFVPLGWVRFAVLVLGLVIAGAIIYAVAKRQKMRRWWLYVLVGPVFATVVVTLLQIVLAFVLQRPAKTFAIDPWRALAPEG
ncbi:hypothetical protein [Bradyrhizobium cenepequi]|uniref:hypothetical protein n=1 Tax=Bradyrhizobium cenepequi TaxID=2821403 RepID=UPI001CE255BB|nr:hypothetical protein [Bradyrhizobium cenepequi]MCA6111275.1 hypothetical protein [Bradyrhizobium cenepequi]